MNILSFDGGGILGVVPLAVLKMLENEYPGHLNKYDFYAGTSTGGLIAIMLALDIPLEDIFKIYYNEGVDIFSKSFLGTIAGLGGLTSCKYSNKKLIAILKRTCGDKTLGDVKKRLLITSFLLDDKDDEYRSWSPKIYDNFDDKYAHIPLWELGIMTSAAPTFFPTFKRHIDGGVIANDPSMCALTQVGVNNVNFCLSLGTGVKPKYIDEDKRSGIIGWASALISILMEGNSELTQYHARALLGERYLRINPVFTKDYALDAVGEVSEIVRTTFSEPLPSDTYPKIERSLGFTSKVFSPIP